MLNNNTKRVVFIGGKNVGCGCLEYLINSALNTEIVAIFVNYNSDILENRWYKSATEIAFKNNIPVYAPKRINSKRSIEIVRNYNPDFIVVIYYDQILNDEIIKIPKHGCINLHMALAEEYRGCFPTTWAIINNELNTGITIHYIDTGVVVDVNTIIEWKMRPINGLDRTSMGTSTGTVAMSYFGHSNANKWELKSNGANIYSIADIDYNVHLLRLVMEDGLYVDGIKQVNWNTGTELYSHNPLLLNGYNSSTGGIGTQTTFYVKIWQNGVLVRCFEPQSDGTFLDTINNKIKHLHN